MKRVLLFALSAVIALSVNSFAGAYHMGTSLSCYQCHTMHYSQQHLYGYPYNNDIYLAQGGPFNQLLRGPVNELCLSCHNGASTIDVYQDQEVPDYTNRQGGFLNMVGDSSVYTGHTLNSTDQAPGSNPAWSNVDGLNCANCHSPHGDFGDDPNYPDPKGQWRNLRINPGNASAVYLTYDTTTGVNTERDVHWRVNSAHAAGAYETDNVDFYEPVSNGSQFGAWCQGCHTNFHGSSSDPNMHNVDGWVRHPVADANLDPADFASHIYRPQVMSASGDWGTQGQVWQNPPADLTPSCFTCHKGHGNDRPFGLIQMTGDVPRTENGDNSKITATCKICHEQGS